MSLEDDSSRAADRDSSSGPEPSGASEPSTATRVALGVIAALVLLYSVLVATRPLLGVLLVILVFGAYLAWRSFLLAERLVAAIERLADATEADD
jgi:uncharacterized membrane protein